MRAPFNAIVPRGYQIDNNRIKQLVIFHYVTTTVKNRQTFRDCVGIFRLVRSKLIYCSLRGRVIQNSQLIIQKCIFSFSFIKTFAHRKYPFYFSTTHFTKIKITLIHTFGRAMYTRSVFYESADRYIKCDKRLSKARFKCAKFNCFYRYFFRYTYAMNVSCYQDKSMIAIFKRSSAISQR